MTDEGELGERICRKRERLLARRSDGKVKGRRGHGEGRRDTRQRGEWRVGGRDAGPEGGEGRLKGRGGVFGGSGEFPSVPTRHQNRSLRTSALVSSNLVYISLLFVLHNWRVFFKIPS